MAGAGWLCIWERRLRFAPTVRSDLASLDTAYPRGVACPLGWSLGVPAFVSCDAQPDTHSPTRTATTPDHTTPTSTSHVEVDVATSLRLRRRRCRAPLISSRISPHATAVSCAHVRVDGWSAVEGRIRVRLKSAAWAWAWGGVMERSPSGWGCGARACAGVPDAGWAFGRPAPAPKLTKTVGNPV